MFSSTFKNNRAHGRCVVTSEQGDYIAAGLVDLNLRGLINSRQDQMDYFVTLAKEFIEQGGNGKNFDEVKSTTLYDFLERCGIEPYSKFDATHIPNSIVNMPALPLTNDSTGLTAIEEEPIAQNDPETSERLQNEVAEEEKFEEHQIAQEESQSEEVYYPPTQRWENPDHFIDDYYVGETDSETNNAFYAQEKNYTFGSNRYY